MGKKRPERTERRAGERAARRLVRERERLAALSPGGAPERPIAVEASSVIEPHARSLSCPQCQGDYTIDDHQAPSAAVRVLAVTCRRCHAPRRLWFRIAPALPS